MHPRRWQFDSRLSADGSMAKLQAASVPIAQDSCAPRAAAPWDRQTDGSRYRLMPLYGGGHKMKVERRTVQKLERKNTTAATTEFLIFSLNAVDDNSITTHAVTTTSASDLELCVLHFGF